ncbi:MAG: glucose-6-phosphate dehydrogenase [Actinomycetota bacterium]|nr:glucose-6-phosphate dehydrogenase [Actinomycetota bacterium]
MSDNPLLEGLETDRRAPPCVLVVYGASGDLTSRKILPAIEQLHKRRQLPGGFAVVGTARTEMDDDDFRAMCLKSVPDAAPGWEELVRGFRYVAGDYTATDTFDRLKEVLTEVDDQRGTSGNRVHYLATIPALFDDIARALGREDMNTPKFEGSFVRVVCEKPYGRDLASARELDDAMHSAFSEDQIYRIDHYLGKETVQNTLALRFANTFFEPLWSRQHIDHVQVTVAESVGVGSRAGFYETAGALRDIVQNHVLQVLAVCSMEPPATLDPTGVRDEKVKALRAIRPWDPDDVVHHVVRAQYAPGWAEGEQVKGYRDEQGVASDSTTETFVALRLEIDNWRWAGVPFYVRTGKRLPKRVTEVAFTFKPVPHLPFPTRDSRGLSPNALVLRIQPDEGITLRFGAKVPGGSFEVRDVLMDFSYGASFLEDTPDAYERLLLDAMVGDPTLFIRADEVEQAWKICDPILEAWQDPSYPVATYEAGSWGPKEADLLLQRDGRKWRTP